MTAALAQQSAPAWDWPGLAVLVQEDPHAEKSYRWVASASIQGSDYSHRSAASTPELAEQEVRLQLVLRRLGVQDVGPAVPDESRQENGQVAWAGCRFALWRHLSADSYRIVHWVMLNPSTATGDADDATLRKITAYSRAWGFGWLTVGNVYPVRSTDPGILPEWSRNADWRLVEKNRQWVSDMARAADLVVCGWGVHGAVGAGWVEGMLGERAHALRVTKNGHPQHPLYLPGKLSPRPLGELREESRA